MYRNSEMASRREKTTDLVHIVKPLKVHEKYEQESKIDSPAHRIRHRRHSWCCRRDNDVRKALLVAAHLIP